MGGTTTPPHWVLCALCQIEGFKRGSYPPFIRPQTPHGEALRVGLRSHTARPCRTYPEGQGVGCPHRTKDILACECVRKCALLRRSPFQNFNFGITGYTISIKLVVKLLTMSLIPLKRQ